MSSMKLNIRGIVQSNKINISAMSLVIDINTHHDSGDGKRIFIFSEFVSSNKRIANSFRKGIKIQLLNAHFFRNII